MPDAGREGVLEYQNPLDLSVKDKTLVEYVDNRIDKSRNYFKTEKKLYSRQEKNLQYLLGLGQIDFTKLKDHQAKYMDNLIYESEASIKPIALSRLPELFVKPASAGDEAKQVADDLTKILNNDIRQRETRSTLGLAFRQHPVFFIGIIKYRWDANKGKFGDYVFETVHTKNVVLDHTARRADADKMDFIAEVLEMSIKEATILFPAKKQEIFKEAGLPLDEPPTESQLGTKIKIYEVWFSWHESKKNEDEDEDDQVFTKVEGVCWKFGKTILKKMKNPNFDWEGDEEMMVTVNGEKKKASPEDLKAALLAQMGATIEGVPQVSVEKTYRNYFAHPRKPYIFITYDQWGEMPYDETSRIEQSIPLQDTVNKRGRQITEMADRTRGKYIFSTDSGITNLSTILLSATNSTPSEHIMPIAVDPCLTVFFAYSTCKSRPSGLNMVIALS